MSEKMSDVRMSYSFSLPITTKAVRGVSDEWEMLAYDSTGDFMFQLPDDICIESVVAAINAYDSNQELIAKQAEQIELYKAAFEAANAKLGEIGQTLYGEGLCVADWHQNGDLEEMDTFFDDNDWDEVNIDEIKERLAATAKG